MKGYSFPTSICRTLQGVAKALVVIGCGSLGACSSIGLGSSDMAVDNTITGSISSHQPPLLAGIDPSDWEILLAKISSYDKATLTTTDDVAANWANPETGSKGRITQVKLLPSLVDEECRSFKSSMHRVTGVENIEGQICRGHNGNWQITGFATGATV